MIHGDGGSEDLESSRYHYIFWIFSIIIIGSLILFIFSRRNVIIPVNVLRMTPGKKNSSVVQKLIRKLTTTSNIITGVTDVY